MQHTNQWQSSPISARNLDIYRVILELIAYCKPLIPRIVRFNKRSANQLIESLLSTEQNLSEGMRRTGADRAHFLTIMLGSADEVRAILDGAHAFDVITPRERQGADALADRICAMGYRLRQKSR
jgi:four helix bundle protein